MLRSVITSLLGFFLVTLWCRMAQAAPLSEPGSCLPPATSLQTLEILPAHQKWNKSFQLSSMRMDQIRQTPVLVEAEYDPVDKRALKLKFKFEDPNIMSLPFNIYAVFVSVGKSQVKWIDLTESCSQPGIGFFPGQEVTLDPIFLNPEEAAEPMHLMIWGRH